MISTDTSINTLSISLDWPQQSSSVTNTTAANLVAISIDTANLLSYLYSVNSILGRILKQSCECVLDRFRYKKIFFWPRIDRYTICGVCDGERVNFLLSWAQLHRSRKSNWCTDRSYMNYHKNYRNIEGHTTKSKTWQQPSWGMAVLWKYW